MKFKEIIQKNRSYRRFYEKRKVNKQVLIDLIDLARLSPSASNKQPLKFIISCDKKTNNLIFPCLIWAGLLKDWRRPEIGERPSAYIVILHDRSIRPDISCDHGIAAQSILLGAIERGYGGCMIGDINKKQLSENLHISKWHEVALVVALGKPKEKVVIDCVRNEETKYWRDSHLIHHVPKRSLKEITFTLKQYIKNQQQFSKSSCPLPQNKESEEIVKKVILKLEKNALDRWAKGDPSGFLNISSQNVTYFDPFIKHRLNGLKELIAYYDKLKGTVKIDRYKLICPKITICNGVVVLTYNYVSYSSKGRHHWNCTEVYQKIGSHWRIMQTHWSFTQPLQK